MWTDGKTSKARLKPTSSFHLFSSSFNRMTALTLSIPTPNFALTALMTWESVAPALVMLKR